jgi:hypothetical protein
MSVAYRLAIMSIIRMQRTHVFDKDRSVGLSGRRSRDLASLNYQKDKLRSVHDEACSFKLESMCFRGLQYSHTYYFSNHRQKSIEEQCSTRGLAFLVSYEHHQPDHK